MSNSPALEDFHPQVEKALGLGKNSSESERLNAYSEAYATMGRTGSLMDEVTRESINPIKEALYETKVDMTQLGNYLIGLVSPQVNRAVANNRKAAGLEELVDKDGNAAGSGLTNAQAKAMVESAMLDKGVRDFVNHKSNPIEKIFNLHKKSLEMMVNSEMISNEQYQKMLNASLDENGNFRRLPFKGMWWLDNSEFANQKAIDDLFGGSSRASGKGFDQPKKKDDTGSMGRQLGSYANPLGMLEHAISFHQETVIRSQRNVVAKKIVEMHDKLREAFKRPQLVRR